VWWVYQEVLPHGAEVALLRDVYRVREGTAGGLWAGVALRGFPPPRGCTAANLGFKPKIDARISCRNHTEQTIAIAAKNASVRKKNEVLTPLCSGLA
jgi:hypothetical protein